MLLKGIFGKNKFIFQQRVVVRGSCIQMQAPDAIRRGRLVAKERGDTKLGNCGETSRDLRNTAALGFFL